MCVLLAEQNDGIRFAWNVLPGTKASATPMAIPVSCMYTPFKAIDSMYELNYPPVMCNNNDCKGVLNPYCQINFANNQWMCPFCLTRNVFPASYASMTAQNPVAEIMQQNTTIEYILDAQERVPIFLFLVDLCIHEEELEALKSCILQNLMLVPEDSMVGLVTLGSNVNVYEMTFDECPKSYIFNGTKEYKTADVSRLLGIKTTQTGQADPRTEAFIAPLAICESNITAIFEDLTKDTWQHKKQERPKCCTGTAMSIAISLLEACSRGNHGRILSFLGTPPTIGPGKIVGLERKEHIRSQHDIIKNRTTHYKAACDYYKTLSARAVKVHFAVDIFACCLDQIGLAEMRTLVEDTGGYLVLDDSFEKGVFSGSFKQLFTRDESKGEVTENLAMAFSAQLQVMTSREFKVRGAIGACTSLNRQNTSISTNPLGIGDTCAWNLGALDRQTSLALYFENAYDKQDQLRDTKQGYLQIMTTYRHSTGRTHLRVSTISKTYADHANQQGLNYLRAGFDQEAAAVLVARYATWRSQTEGIFDIRGWIDRTLIKLCSMFGNYVSNQPESFRLSSNLSFFPQFMFHLRRSQFLQVFNFAPDQTTFSRLVLSREHVSNVVTMIQPSLVCFSLDGPAKPVALELGSCQPNRILLLDTYFHVVVWYGQDITQWQTQGVHLQPGYEYFAQLLKAPKNDAQRLLKSRFPFPMYVECVHEGSQERFLTAKLSPPAPTEAGQQGSTPQLITEDVSFKVFMQHLKRLAVQKS